MISYLGFLVCLFLACLVYVAAIDLAERGYKKWFRR